MWTALGLLGASAIAGSSALYSSSLQTGAATSINHATRRFNREEAQKQRDWQEQMANTQYQRMVKDLSAAGLNPLLATGASPTSPVGSSAVAGSPLVGDYSGVEKAGSAFGNAIRSIASNEVDKARSEADKAKAEVSNTEKAGELLDAQIQNVSTDTDKKSADTTRTKVGTVKDIVAPLVSAGATAYAGKKAGDAAKALVGAGLTKNSASEIVKEIAPKAASSARQARTLWPVLGGLSSLGLYGAGAGASLYLGKKIIENKKKLEKRDPSMYRAPNPLFMFH